MRITIITGSGHKESASAFLADEFERGARKNGHAVFRFNAAVEKINPCVGCNCCRNTNSCIYNDSFSILAEELLLSDVIVWATPVYYMTMTAQLKAVIDRMYQLETQPQFMSKKKYILLATAWYNNKSVFDVLSDTFESFCGFLNWEKSGEVLAYGVNTKSDLYKSDYLEQAYCLGQNLVES